MLLCLLHFGWYCCRLSFFLFTFSLSLSASPFSPLNIFVSVPLIRNQSIFNMLLSTSFALVTHPLTHSRSNLLFAHQHARKHCHNACTFKLWIVLKIHTCIHNIYMNSHIEISIIFYMNVHNASGWVRGCGCSLIWFFDIDQHLHFSVNNVIFRDVTCVRSTILVLFFLNEPLSYRLWCCAHSLTLSRSLYHSAFICRSLVFSSLSNTPTRTQNLSVSALDIHIQFTSRASFRLF